ncbi:MAG: lysine exporter LysO family protein [Candidatus Saccharibacteria bacterium]
MWRPFLWLAVGAILAPILHRWADRIMKYSLYLLLLGLGAGIGANKAVVAAIPRLGLRALTICLLASAVSILLAWAWEKLFAKSVDHDEVNESDDSVSDLSQEYYFILFVVMCLVGGIFGGYSLPVKPQIISWVIDLSLIAIYVSVGAGLVAGLEGLKSQIGKARYLWVPVLITVGSVAGGLLAAKILGTGLLVTGAVGGGMGYYSLTAAILTQNGGAEPGFVAFLANFLREVLTFFLTPLLARFSRLAPIALGGATTMDTTLAVIKRSLGEEYAILGLLSGAVLTLVVPFLLVFILSL